MKSAKKNVTTSFVLQCLRASSSEELEVFLQECVAQGFEIDWESILNRTGKLLPVLTGCLFAYREVISIPPEIVFGLQAAYLETARQNDVMRNEVLSLARACKSANLPLIFLKGAALLLTVYRGNEAVRMMSDMDVLVREDDLLRSEALCIRAGYHEDYRRYAAEVWKNNYRPKEYYREYHKHLVYYKDALRLELHWDIHHRSSADFLKKLWACCETVMVDDVEARVFNAAATIFSICNNCVDDFPTAFPDPWRHDLAIREPMAYFVLFFLYEIKTILNQCHENENWVNLQSLIESSENKFDILTLLLLAERIVKARIPKIVFSSSRFNLCFNLFRLFVCFKSYYSVYELLRARDEFSRWDHLNHHPERLPGILFRKTGRLLRKGMRLMFR